MRDPDLAPLLVPRWSALSHRVARDQLEHLGWTLSAQGDWAYVYRSPHRGLAARVSPFEPIYGYFVDLCRRSGSNRYVPRLDLATPLEGGGHLAVLEWLDVPDQRTVGRFLRQWERPEEADADLRALRLEVDRIDAWGRRNVPWWVGIDLAERHVLLSSDGLPKVIDLFGLSSTLLHDLVEDPQAFAQRIPPDRCRYLLEMPDLQADDHPEDYVRRIRDALARIG